MKKAAMVLTIVMVLSICACGGKETPTEVSTDATTASVTEPATTPSESQEDIYGFWKVQKTVDEFGDVTEDSETVVSTVVDGSFSNTATSKGDLAVAVYMSIYGDGDTSFFVKNGRIYTQTVVGDYPYFSFRLR